MTTESFSSDLNIVKGKILATVNLIIQSSADGEGNWINLMPLDIPEWVKEDQNIGRMMSGDMICYNEKQPYRWYRAYEIPESEKLN